MPGQARYMLYYQFPHVSGPWPTLIIASAQPIAQFLPRPHTSALCPSPVSASFQGAGRLSGPQERRVEKRAFLQQQRGYAHWHTLSAAGIEAASGYLAKCLPPRKSSQTSASCPTTHAVCPAGSETTSPGPTSVSVPSSILRCICTESTKVKCETWQMEQPTTG